MMRSLKQQFRERSAGALVISLPGGRTWRYPLSEREIADLAVAYTSVLAWFGVRSALP